MNRFVLIFSYDGSKYSGLQKLKKESTIQGELEKILERLDGAPVKVISSGRTDRGVHALNQCCMFDLKRKIDPYKLKGYINRKTSSYLFVKSCEHVKNEHFHARFSVKIKTYKYLINTEIYDPIKEDYLYNYNKKLDLEKMKNASKLLIGPHDYRAFVTGKQKTCETIIESIDIEEKDCIITICFKGKAFYTYMVRNLVAVLILIGSGKLKEQDILKMLQTGKKVIEYAPAPPGGLYLENVLYEENYI